jgi:hypothetical protein
VLVSKGAIIMFATKSSAAYFVSRHGEEVAAAEAATTHEARIVHLELALRYSLLAASTASPTPKPHLTEAVVDQFSVKP